MDPTSTRRSFLGLTIAAAASRSAAAPLPRPVPSERQLAWHKLEQYAFLHFTINTFTDKEWGYGDEDPNLFNPSEFNADAIVRALAAGGMKGVILTCKHHDGFCLWPTKTTEHCVRNTKWRGGQGDVVREISDAARRHGLKFGVYLSPWDRNSALYGSPKYVELYREQLGELLTRYGPIFEVWHDGANGGDGFYGGSRERRTIDKRTYYDWPNTWGLVRKLQPSAVIFSDIGPDVRWVGNEKGIAAEDCWATITPVGESGGEPAVGDVRTKDNQTGHRDGQRWLPAECDVSIRPGWFWHEKENSRVKTPEQLVDLFFKSVGRNASFLLNVPPDRRGLLHETDVKSLADFGAAVKQMFSRNLAGGSARSRGAVTVKLARDSQVRVVRMREDIRLGHRVYSWALEADTGGVWKTIAEGAPIGSCRLVRLPDPVAATALRLRVREAAADPVISEFSAF